MKIIKLLICVMFLAPFTQGAVWENEKEWNKEWEDKFSEWVRTEYSEDFYMVGKYKGIATDCADALYGARMIFAYENKLPFVIKDLTSSSTSNKMISNEMSRYDEEATEMDRLMKFMRYVFNITNTRSLPFDTYPVQINRNYVRPGISWIRPRATAGNLFSGGSETPGHADMVKEVKDTGVIYMIGSTVPQANRYLKITSGLVFMPESTRTGLRAWKSKETYLMDVESLPGYSQEQFTMGYYEVDQNSEDWYLNTDGKNRDLNSWTEAITKRLKLRDESKDEEIARYAANACAYIKERVEVVLKSEKERAFMRRCMSEREYDLYSTPSRDAKIVKALKSMMDLKYDWFITSESKVKSMKKYLTPDCRTLEYKPGKKVEMVNLMYDFLNGNVSSDPNQKLKARWGLAREEASSCKIYY